MIRKTAFGLVAAAATLAAAMGATASTASAGVKFNIHVGGYGYYAPYYGFHCKRVFVGYRKVWTYYGWVKKPIYKKYCY